MNIHTPCNNNSMAILGFSNKASPLEPIWPSTHRALLPLCGKSLVIYQIENLISKGYKHIRLAGSIQQWAVRRRIKDGNEWGVTIRYSDLLPGDLINECILTTGGCTYLEGDNLLPIIEKLTASTSGFNNKQDTIAKKYETMLNNDSLFKYQISTPDDYHKANLKIARNPKLFNIPGASIHDDHAYTDWNSSISPDAYIGKNVFIGKHSKIGNLVRLENNCVLSNGVIVGNKTKLKNVTVMPNCVIAPNLALSDCIISPAGLIDLNGRYWPSNNTNELQSSRGSKETLTGLPSNSMSL